MQHDDIIASIIASNDALPVQLTKGQFAIVDAADYLLVCQFHWRYHPQGYAYRDTKNIPKGESGMMHRLIMQPPREMVVDHISGNGLDNRRCNLRICTPMQNRHNQSKYTFIGIIPTSRHKGVKAAKGAGRWSAQINVHGRLHHLGTYDSEDEAARVYNGAAYAAYGDYARLNIIGDGDGI